LPVGASEWVLFKDKPLRFTLATHGQLRMRTERYRDLQLRVKDAQGKFNPMQQDGFDTFDPPQFNSFTSDNARLPILSPGSYELASARDGISVLLQLTSFVSLSGPPTGEWTKVPIPFSVRFVLNRAQRVSARVLQSSTDVTLTLSRRRAPAGDWLVVQTDDGDPERIERALDKGDYVFTVQGRGPNQIGTMSLRLTTSP
jgi:hypothetical protein